MHEHVRDVAPGKLERDRKAVAQVVLASRSHRRVDREDQRFKPGIAGARDELVRQRAIRPHVQLEPQGAADLRHFFHGRHGPHGQRERYAVRRRGARQRDFALVPRQPGRTGRRDDDRHLLLLSEQGYLLAALRNVDQNARFELDAVERKPVVTHRDLVIVAAVHELEQPFRQPAPRGLAQVGGVIQAQRVVLHSGSGADPHQRRGIFSMARASSTVATSRPNSFAILAMRAT